MKILALAAASLILAGCLEAVDLMGGGIRANTQYCQIPDGVARCDQVKAQPAP